MILLSFNLHCPLIWHAALWLGSTIVMTSTCTSITVWFKYNWTIYRWDGWPLANLHPWWPGAAVCLPSCSNLYVHQIMCYLERLVNCVHNLAFWSHRARSCCRSTEQPSGLWSWSCRCSTIRNFLIQYVQNNAVKTDRGTKHLFVRYYLQQFCIVIGCDED